MYTYQCLTWTNTFQIHARILVFGHPPVFVFFGGWGEDGGRGRLGAFPGAVLGAGAAGAAAGAPGLNLRHVAAIEVGRRVPSRWGGRRGRGGRGGHKNGAKWNGGKGPGLMVADWNFDLEAC